MGHLNPLKEYNCIRIPFCDLNAAMQTIVQPFPMRSKVFQEAGTLRIAIPVTRFWVALFIVVWLTFWTYGGLQIGHKLLRHFELFNFVWMCFWVVAECGALYFLLRVLGGSDVIEATAAEFTLRKQVFSLGMAKVYLVSEMRDLRFQPEAGGGRGHRASQIAFDYGAKTIGFGEGIDEAEAAQLITLIQTHSNVARTTGAPTGGIKFWQQS